MPERILFTTSNGTGLGHLTRSMAIARRLGPELEPLFLTLSAAAPVVREMGFPVEYVPSYGTPGSGNDLRWSRRLRARLRAAVSEADPAVVVFDGTHPYEALLGALRPESAAVWCRRPLWKQGSSRAPLGREGAFDAVLEPGELAESEDRGPTVARRDRAHRVAPIVLLDRDELLPRAEAEAELGLEPGRINVLVALGQGAEVREATARCLRHLAGRDDVQVAALSSAIAAAEEGTEGVIALRATYPMSRYFAAFDAAVAAAGYNAYHELIALGVPSLFVPMRRDTDDQPARSRYAQRAGLGLGGESAADPRLEGLLDELLDDGTRDAIRTRLASVDLPNGAGDAADWLCDLAAGRARGRHPPASPPGKSGFPGRPGVGGASPRGAALDASAPRGSFRAWRRRWGTFVGSVPQTAIRLGRQQLTQPRTRTVVAALGLPGERVAPAVREALADTSEEPGRVLAITDALDALAELRALGVGVEHVPARGERQAELAGGGYEAFVRRRVELILAERPRPRRVLVAPGSAPLP